MYSFYDLPARAFWLRFSLSRANISPGLHALFAQNLKSGAGSPSAGEHLGRNPALVCPPALSSCDFLSPGRTSPPGHMPCSPRISKAEPDRLLRANILSENGLLFARPHFLTADCSLPGEHLPRATYLVRPESQKRGWVAFHGQTSCLKAGACLLALTF